MYLNDVNNSLLLTGMGRLNSFYGICSEKNGNKVEVNVLGYICPGLGDRYIVSIFTTQHLLMFNALNFMQINVQNS